MAISELQLLQRESSRIRSGGTVQSPTQLLQTNLQKNASTKNEQNQKDTSFWGGVGYTLEKLGLGVLRGVEGVADFVVGGVADLFGGESGDEFAENVMKSDWVNYGHADEWYDAGETMSFVGDVASGIGNMLPAIAVNFIPGVGQAASAAISTATFATSAAGQATSDIVKETGELSGKEWLYGTASGALEAGIEYISGGIGGTAAGKGLAKAFGKTTLGKVAGNFIGEGLEEVASDIANPLLKRATGVDKNAGIDWKGLPRTFAVGGATGAVMGGGKRVIDAAKVGGFNNLNTIESAQELTERQADNNIRQIKGKSAIYTEQDIARTKENLSKRLRKMDDTTRAQFLKANSNIANQFNEDGTVKDFAPAPETYNEGTYSASLKGRESTLAYKPVAETSAESAVAKKVMKTLTKMTDGNTNIVLTEDALTTEDGQKANGLYKDGVIYLDAKATDYDKALTVGVHEVIHGLEGTKEYNDLASYIAETISKDPELAKKYSVEKYRAVYDKILEGEWTEATKDYQASTEIFADYLANKVVTNEKMLNNLVMRNSNVVVRFVNWVRNSIAKLGDDAEERLMRKGLKKLEKALGKALEAGTGGISLERVEELSKSAEKRLKTQDGNIQSVKFEENKKADGKLATARASIQTIDGRAIVVIDTDQDIFNGKDKAEYPKIVRQYMLARFKNKVLPIGKNKAYVNRQGLEEYAYPADRRMDEKLKTAKMKAGTELNNLLATAEYVEHQEDDGRHEDAVRGWDKYKTQFIVDEQLFEGEISLKLTQRGDVFYDMSKIKNITPGTSRSKSPTSSQSDVVEGNPSTSIIRENSEKSTQNAKKVEKTSTSRKSIDVEYANAIKDGDTALAQKMVDQAAKEAGYDKKRFHETKEENIIHVFNLDLNTNASADYGTPFGVFTKKHNRSVGLGGKQMSLYVKADRTFSVKDRTEIAKRLPQEYSSFVDKINAIDEEYDVKYEKFSDDLLDSFAEWLDENDANDKMRNAWDIQKTLEEQFGDVLPQDIIEKERKFLKVSAEWNEKTNQAILNAKKWLTKWLRTNNYDSMELEFDNGAGNRVTDALIVLDQEQVKSAEPATYDDNGNLIPLSKRFNKKTADIRYSLPINIEADVKKYYGSTYRWNETGYILQDGTRLDLSGRNEGSRGGYRAIDHRDIFSIFEDDDYSYGTDALNEFIARGNIRVMPETPGINLSVEPNAEQYRLIQDFVERVGWEEGYFSVDIDNKNGDTIETLTYEGKPSGRKVVADLKQYFKTGEKPYQSKLSSFRYSIDVDSAGNTLTKEQTEYFKDSKVRDKDGNLLVVYHGTRKADFTEFKRNINFYTDSEEMADSYAPSSEKYVGYLNIENPFVIDAKGERWSRIPIDAKTKAFLEKYGASTFKENGKWRTSPADIASAIESGIDEGELDYDGIIIKNIDDTGRYWKTRDNIVANDYITFKSNQFKNTSNKNPTKNPDIRYALDAELDKKTTERVQTVVSDEKLTLKERWENTVEKLKEGKADQWIKAQIAWTDEQAGIIAAGKNLGIVMHGEVQRARVAKASAINMLNNAQRDYSGTKRVGDSLKAIFKPIQSRGKKVAQAFNLYLLHQLNVDRMSAVERGLRDEVAPVFEKDVDKAFSLEKIQQLEKQYPEFKETAEKVWNYNQNLLQYRVDAGLITQEQADKMTEMYPHYVPAFYEKNGGGTSGAFVGQKGIAVKTGIKSAKGSTGVSDIKDVQASIAKQTVAVVRAASINKIVEKLYDGAVAKGDFTDIKEVGREKMTDPDVDYDKEIPKEDNVYFYKDGERITLAVTKYVDAGFRGLTAGAQMGDPITTLSAKSINLFKKVVTAWNPVFAVTNAVRDAQEALFYTKYGKRFFANYGKALTTRKHDPRLKELWEQYKAMGGAGSGYFSQDTGVFDDRSKLRKSVNWLGDKMQIVNEWVEQAPRFAEFVASVEAGNSLEQALYDSAEVTTNFSRGGKMAKALNRHLIPFLNPSIQGWSKMWRGWVAPMDGKSAAEIERLSKQSKGRRFLSNYGALMFKAILCGVSVGLFNDMLYRWIDDDEDYANLPLNIKENYYLIKVGKKFIKIPKGRVVALYGSVWTRLSEAMNGNEDALNAWDWAKSASEMVSPLESAFRSIIAPVRDVQTNTTWYGGQIENASMENLAPSERYDEGTSKIAIAIGKVLNKSPKKIHYILDQYSGVIGDVILPLTTNKAEKGMFSSRFVVDPVYNNDISTKYYDYKEELTFAKNSGDTNAKLMLKYMNEVQDALSKMYQQKRDIANDKSLTNKEKREQTEIVQSLINATLSSSVDMADEFEQLLINSGFEQAVSILGNNATYKKMDEEARNSAYNKLVDYYYNVCLSRLNNTKVDTKYTLYGAINATDIVVYLTDINNIESDTDKKGNVIQGSRKEKVQKYIQGLKLTAQQKYILSYLAGYAPTDNGKSAISKYLKNNGYTQKEINEIWN